MRRCAAGAGAQLERRLLRMPTLARCIYPFWGNTCRRAIHTRQVMMQMLYSRRLASLHSYPCTQGALDGSRSEKRARHPQLLFPAPAPLCCDKEFAQMKKGSFFLNASRGNVVVIPALAEAANVASPGCPCARPKSACESQLPPVSTALVRNTVRSDTRRRLRNWIQG